METLIRLIAPGLNLVLAAGERLSKVVSPEDDEYYPVRSGLTDPSLSRPRAPAER